MSIPIYIIITIGVLGIYNYFLSRGMKDVILHEHTISAIFWMVLGSMFGREVDKKK